jgi:hypothetical protein
MVDVVDQGLDVGELDGVGNGPPIGIETALPARIHVDVVVAVGTQARRNHGVGLLDDVGLGEEVIVDCLLAESAPAQIRFLRYAVDLRASHGGYGEQSRSQCTATQQGPVIGVHRECTP